MILSIFYQLFVLFTAQATCMRYVYIVYISQTKLMVTSLEKDILGVDIFAQ